MAIPNQNIRVSILKIRELNKKGIDNSEIYKLYPQVTKTTIRDIIDYKTWKHLL